MELLLPALGLIICSAFLLRMVLPQRRRATLDAAAQALWRLLRHGPTAWLARRRETRAQREAREAIERARRSLQQGARRPGSKSARSPDDGPAEVHDLDQHRRKRRPAKPPEDDPPEPPRPTLH
jgi:hypothetical protein